MKVLQQNGNTCTPQIPNIRGLRIETITLDAKDVSKLWDMCAHPEDITDFIQLLGICMFKPTPSPARIGMPIDVENFLLMKAGKNYLMETGE